MAVHCGFFNSVNGDKKYEAEMMSRPYELLISNGVFATPEGTPSNYLQVYPSEGMRITVKAGRGMFFDKWFINDSDMPLIVEPSDVILNRIDSVIVKVDKSEAVRAGTIYIKKGTPASSPVAPELIRSGTVMEYRLANIQVNANVNSITQAMISDRRGYTEECGWVTSLVQQVDTTTLWEQWQAAFEDWFFNVRDTLASSTLIRSYTATYTTTKQDETLIPINISRYNHDLDILQVYINGLLLVPEVEYNGNDNNTDITLTNGVDAGTPISFIVYKSVDGADAETVIGEVEELFGRVEGLENTRITDATGSVKLSITDESKSLLDEFIALGVGFHTVYSVSNVKDSPTPSAGYRSFGHRHTENNGWIMSFHTNGSVYANFYFTGEWRGWRVLHESVPEPLWSGTNLMGAGATITPSKPLNMCAHGWQLIFSDYNDDTSSGSSADLSTVMIPERNLTGANWGGSSFLCLVPTFLSETGEHNMCVKKVYVYPDRLEGIADNVVTNVQKDTALRAIYEY